MEKNAALKQIEFAKNINRKLGKPLPNFGNWKDMSK
jgi:hypothetical protein